MADQVSVISIRVSEDGDFYVEPSSKRLKPGQSITWTSSQGPFAISFTDQTPFSQVLFQGIKPADREGVWTVTSHPVKPNAPGIFHYAVSIYVNGRVYLEAGCPQVIIEE